MNDPNDKEELDRLLVQAYSEQLKVLLETKHIYQKVTIDVDALVSRVLRSTEEGDTPLVMKNYVAGVLEIFERLTPTTSSSLHTGNEDRHGQYVSPVLQLRNVKIFCSHCGGREIFAPVHWYSLMNELGKYRERFDGTLPKAFQIFYLAYLCQACKQQLTTFIVRRNDSHLTLDGRSPFEELEVPSFIPKKELKHFRDALIASHGGKPLAALLYLRTFIEQFARRVAGVTGKVTGDELMDKYAVTLPAAQRDQMPSLREWYDKLSEALHAARSDEALFEEAREKIELHFNIRNVFKMSEMPPPQATG